MNGNLATNIFRGVTVGMFAIILAMTGYIVHTITDSVNGVDAREMLMESRMQSLGERLSQAEIRICDLRGIRC